MALEYLHNSMDVEYLLFLIVVDYLHILLDFGYFDGSKMLPHTKDSEL
jgi:hypothetical protein